MARQRDDQGFDDDDYLPPQQSNVTSGRRTPTWVFIVLGAVGLVIGASAVMLVIRSQRAIQQARAVAEEDMHRVAVAQAQQPAMPARLTTVNTKAATSAPRGKPGANWAAAIGTWRRGPYSRIDELPVEIILRPDFTAQVTRVRPTQNFIDEALVEVKEDADDRLALILHTAKGETVYSFRTKSNGTLVYDDGGVGLTLSRLK